LHVDEKAIIDPPQIVKSVKSGTDERALDKTWSTIPPGKKNKQGPAADHRHDVGHSR